MSRHFAGNERDRFDCKLGAHDDQEVTARPINVEHFRSMILHVLVHEHDVWLSVGQFRLFSLFGSQYPDFVLAFSTPQQ